MGKNQPKIMGGPFIKAAAASIINKGKKEISEEGKKKRREKQNRRHKLEMNYDLMLRVLICDVHIRVRA